MKKSLIRRERLTCSELNIFFENRNDKSLLVIKTRFFKVFYRKNSLLFSRFAVSVGCKFGNAVCRNHAKRVVREIWRELRSFVRVGYDFVFVLYAHKICYHSTKCVIENLFKKTPVL